MTQKSNYVNIGEKLSVTLAPTLSALADDEAAAMGRAFEAAWRGVRHVMRHWKMEEQDLVIMIERRRDWDAREKPHRQFWYMEVSLRGSE